MINLDYIITWLKKNIRSLYIRADIKYGKELESKEHRIMSGQEFSNLVRLHDEIFPEVFLRYSPYKNIDELKILFPCGSKSQLDWIITNSWYVLLIRHFDCLEIYELAGKNIGANIITIYRYVKRHYPKEVLKATIRETTAYPLLLALVKKDKLVLIDDKIKKSKGEVFHKVYCRFFAKEKSESGYNQG